MYRCVTTLGGVREYLSGTKIIAFDFETAPLPEYRNIPMAALDPAMSQIVGVSFAVAESSGIYVPLAHKRGTNADTGDVLPFLAGLMADPNIIKVAHNLSFEAMFLYHLGVIVQPPCYDTIAATQLTLKSNTGFRTLADSGLKTLVPELYGVDMPKFEEVTDGRHFDELDAQDTETVRYACSDSDYTLRLYHTFNDWFDRFLPKHRYIAEQIESPTSVYCGIMKHNGLPVDKDMMLEKQTQAERELTRLREEIAFFIGDVDIGANASTSAFKQYLYKDMGLPVLKTTAKYQEAADDEAMILLGDYCKENRPELAPLFELIQEYRKWGKL